jgi:T-complex protein 1 subunit beta
MNDVKQLPRGMDLGELTRCLDMNQGIVGSMRQLGVTESYKLKRQVVLSASEAAEMIIR